LIQNITKFHFSVNNDVECSKIKGNCATEAGFHAGTITETKTKIMSELNEKCNNN